MEEEERREDERKGRGKTGQNQITQKIRMCATSYLSVAASLLSVDFLPFAANRSGRDLAETTWGAGRSPLGFCWLTRVLSV